MASDTRIVDGQWDFSAGIDSSKLTTAKSEANPNGLARNQLAWLSNASVRGGGITCRNGWKSLQKVISGLGIYQGGIVYEAEFANPYLICSIAGHIFKILLEAPYTVTDLSTSAALTNPATVPQAFFVQAEQFVVIQAGDYATPGAPNPPVTDAAGRTLPLFWDGTALRRSIGITNTAIGASAPNVNEIPAALCMDYFQGRIWYAQGRAYFGGDIVFNHASGTATYAYRDSILNVTECPLCFGGDGFLVPSQSGNIRALKHTANMDATLGEGDLYVFTLKTVYKLKVPVTRTNWIATDADNMPVQTVVQNVNGAYGDRSVVSTNGDLFYRSLDGIRSLFVSLRYYNQWGNRPISSNENRIFGFEDRSLLRYVSGVAFDNRLWETCLPIQTAVGPAFQGIVPLDFDIISSFGQSTVPAWEGMLEGLYVLELFRGNFGGLERGFGMVVSRLDGSIQLWEFTTQDRFDDADKGAPEGDKRVVWSFETMSYTWEKEYELKKLYGGEIWFDKVYGTVEVRFEYRVDANPCWQFWHQELFCVARSSCEDVTSPVCYPEQPYREGYKFPLILPEPPTPSCSNMPNRRPMNIGYQFQMRVTVKGWSRIRGLIWYALPVQKGTFEGLNC